jgi:CRISPR/Cas system-associated exonuclease Cas4 (RecB family)
MPFLNSISRLIDKIIKLYGASKLRVREAFGELSGADFAKAEKERKDIAISQLPELIQQLADEISMEDKETQAAILNILAKKFASVNYSSLSKKVAAALGTAAPQVQEPEMDDLGLGDDESEIEPLDEYTKRKLQFYAGIIK